jgi:hypothetical protein
MLVARTASAQTGRVASDAPWRFAMLKAQPRLPDMLPVLSRGKHRNPRKGACFMELASYLAGERWSDHPACTHPLLASVARLPFRTATYVPALRISQNTRSAASCRLLLGVLLTFALTAPCELLREEHDPRENRSEQGHPGTNPQGQGDDKAGDIEPGSKQTRRRRR